MLKANKLHHKGIIPSNMCNRILIVLFQDLLAGVKFDTIKIFRAKTTEEKQKTTKFVNFQQKKE